MKFKPENPRVGSSILSQATIFINSLRTSARCPFSFCVPNVCQFMKVCLFCGKSFVQAVRLRPFAYSRNLQNSPETNINQLESF